MTTNEELIALAHTAREAAYAPYSKITVGAALLTRDGKIYTGANIENASYGVTLCAERSAFASALSNKERRFLKIAIAGGRDTEPAHKEFPPCGVCRQVMREFCSDDFEIILASKDGIRTLTLGELLPFEFSRELL